MTWTEADLDRAIAELRTQRKNFLLKPAKAEKATKAPKMSKDEVAAASPDDLLARLGLA